MKRVSFPHFLVWVALLAAAFPALVANGQSEKLRVAISSISTSQVNVWVPLDTGFFKRQGLDVELVYISGAPVGAAALMSGEVAISQGGVTGSITSNLKGSGTYIILGGADRFPYQLVAQPGIKQISELKGKRFAVSRIGSADHTATMFVLPKLGIQPDKEINIVQVGSVPARFAALVNGSVQAALLIPPETVKARELGYPDPQQLCRYRNSLPAKRRLHHARIYQQAIRHPPSVRNRLLGRQPLHSHQLRRHAEDHAQVSPR